MTGPTEWEGFVTLLMGRLFEPTVGLSVFARARSAGFHSVAVPYVCLSAAGPVKLQALVQTRTTKCVEPGFEINKEKKNRKAVARYDMIYLLTAIG